jgi:excisionase family DNA binding protein
MKNQESTLKSDLTIQEAAHIFGCTQKHVYELINRGMLAAYKIGRASRITSESVDRVRSTPFVASDFSRSPTKPAA